MAWLSPDLIEVLLRLGAATVAGMAIGLNRDLLNKPVGVRTLGLVSLGSAVAVVATTPLADSAFGADATSRAIQGVLTGIGFVGAGVILHDNSRMKVVGLTTASTVWVSAVLGIAAGIGEWLVTAAGGALALLVLVLGGPIERRFHQFVSGETADDHSQGD